MRDEAQDGAGAEIEELMWRVDRDLRYETRRQVAASGRRLERQRRAPELRVRRRLAVLVPLLAVTVAANVASLGPFATPERSPSIEETTRDVQLAVRLGVNLVESHRRAEGALPADLASIGLDASHGWTYSAIDADRFRLGLSYRDQLGLYDSGAGRIVLSPAGEVR